MRHRANDLLLVILAIGLIFGAAGVFASQPIPPKGEPDAPCGVLENFRGQVQILDASRTTLIDAVAKAPIPCGGWVSVGKGWAEFKHRQGYRVKVSADSFVQLSDSKSAESGGDHLLLYRGKIFAHSEGGDGQLRIITANARVRMTRATGLVIYRHADEETQLISLDKSGTLENRFEPFRPILVHAGEASTLGVKKERVVPSTPRAVAIASLKDTLADLHLTEEDFSLSIQAARSRKDRKFAKILVADSDEEGADSDRAPASAASGKDAQSKKMHARPAVAKSKSNYIRHPYGAHDKAKLKNQWIKKIAGGGPITQEMLTPDEHYGRVRTVQVRVEDVDAKVDPKRRKIDDEEKRRLLEELSRIPPD
jgi:hypothetical protein